MCKELFSCHKPCPDFPAGPSISKQGAVPLPLPGAWCQQGESGTSAVAPSKALTSTKQRGHEAGILLGIPAGTAPGAVLWGPSSDGGGGRTDLCTQLCTADAPCPPRRAMRRGRGGPSWHRVPQDTLPRPGEPPVPSHLPAPATRRHSPARCSLGGARRRPGSGSADRKQTFGAPRTASPPKLGSAGCPRRPADSRGPSRALGRETCG